MNRSKMEMEEHLIHRCKTGDRKAQFLLYKNYSKAMYNIAIRFLNNRMDAEDVLQESFITAFEKLESLTSYNAFGGWIKRIVINNCISRLRGNHPEYEDINDHETADYPDDEEEFNIDPKLVHNAIKDLPDGGRTVLVLHALEGYKHREISEMLGISESTSKSQYRRALELLYLNLKEKVYAG